MQGVLDRNMHFPQRRKKKEKHLVTTCGPLAPRRAVTPQNRSVFIKT
jgi:hypothetical protein